MAPTSTAWEAGHAQQTGPADLGTPVDDGREPPDVSFVWPGGCSGRRPGGRDGVGGKRLLVRLSTRGDAIALACKYGQTRPTCGSLSAWSWWTWTQRCVGNAICCACALDPRMQFACVNFVSPSFGAQKTFPISEDYINVKYVQNRMRTKT